MSRDEREWRIWGGCPDCDALKATGPLLIELSVPVVPKAALEAVEAERDRAIAERDGNTKQIAELQRIKQQYEWRLAGARRGADEDHQRARQAEAERVALARLLRVAYDHARGDDPQICLMELAPGKGSGCWCREVRNALEPGDPA